MPIHRIKIKDLNEDFIQQIKSNQYDENNEIAVWVSDTKKRMSEVEFWKFIKLLDWTKNRGKTIIETLVEHLSQLSIDKIKSFEDILCEKLYLLDGQTFAENIGENAYKGEDEPFSTDGFLYARCMVVASGQKVYEQVLKNPERMVKDSTFEPLLNVANLAWQRKTGEPMDYISNYIPETFANGKAWNNGGLLEKLLG